MPDPIDPNEASRIAGMLTEAQREGLRNAEFQGGGTQQFAFVEYSVRLPASLAHMFTLRWDRLTPLGLATPALALCAAALRALATPGAPA